MKKVNLLIPLVLSALAGAKAQSIAPSTLNATGGSATIGTTELEWSVSEMTIVSTFSAGNIVVTQGVLQPSDAMVGVPQTKTISKDLKVFPNPASDVVNLQYTASTGGKISCRLFDMTGKEISSQKFDVINGQAIGQVDVHTLAVATYMLEVVIVPLNGASESMTYRIQKLK